MSEQVQEQPAARSPLARLMGVIVSPGETFQDIERRPGWLFPMVAYLVVFTVCFAIYGMKADWIAIVTNQTESFLGGMLGDRALDQAIESAVRPLQKQTQTERTVIQIVNAVPFFIPVYHFWTVVYATLFVLMGSLQSLKLGRAWLWFVICLALLIPYAVVAGVAQAAFADSPQSAMILTALAALVFVGAYLWILNRQAPKDEAFHKVLSVVTHSLAVMIVWCLVVVTVSLLGQEAIETPIQKLVKANLGAILRPDIAVLQTLLEWIDLFVIWSLVVLTIGFRAVTKLSAGLTASVAILPYGVMALVHIAFVAVFG